MGTRHRTSFTFAPTLAPADRDAVLTAVDIRVGQIPNASGMAAPIGDRFHVSLDLGMVSRAACAGRAARRGDPARRRLRLRVLRRLRSHDGALRRVLRQAGDA
jgi:hypothetical protein